MSLNMSAKLGCPSSPPGLPTPRYEELELVRRALDVLLHILEVLKLGEQPLVVDA